MAIPSRADSFNDSMDLFDDVEGEIEEAGATNAQFQCPFCDDYFSSDESCLQSHIQSSHVDNSTQIRTTNHAISNRGGVEKEADKHLKMEVFVCPYCSAAQGAKELFIEHLTLIHGEELEHDDLEDIIRSLGHVLCPLCRYACSSAVEMQQHVDTQHSSRKESHRSDLENKALACSSQVTVCPVCGLDEPDSDLLTSHIELHFDTSLSSGKQDSSHPSTSKKVESPHLSSSSTSSTKSSSSSSSISKTQDRRKKNGYHYKHQYRQGLERDVVKGKMSPGDYYEHLAQMHEKDLNGVDDGHSKVEGLIEHLESFYRNNSRQNQSAVLCSPVDYYCGSYGDKGWGCGYRNFQMMLSGLSQIRMYSSKLFNDGRIRIPSVPKIQEMIETAWQRGFDREGCLQLEAKLAGTRKWIGATEIVATLSSLGIRCELVDFPRASSPDGTHPRLLEWVRDYFHKDQNAKPPLYLQHQGHSRTIVGVEVDKGTIRLLLFDPGSSKEHVSSLKKSQLSWKQVTSFRRNLAAFKARQYQIVSVVGLLSKEGYEQSKRLTSTRIL